MFVLNDLNFAGITAFLAIVALSVQLRVHDVVIDKAHDLNDSRDVVLHVGNLHIADRSAGGKCLELGLEFQLGKSVDWLGNVHMVAVGDIVLVRYALNDAETLLQAFGELVGCTFDGRTVNGERDIGFPFPFVAGIVHVLHDFQCEGGRFRIGVGFPGHVFDTFVQTCIAKGNRGVAAVEQLVDRFAFFETGKSTVLPEDRGSVR